MPVRACSQGSGLVQRDTATRNCSDLCPRSGAWYTLKYADGTEKKFQKADYHKLIKEEEFRQRFLDILHSELIIGYEQSVEENVS